MTAKKKYRELCEKENTICIFSQAWWLDTVCGDQNWDVVIYEKGGLILGALPYYTKKKKGFTILTNPALTQTLGIWLKEQNGKYAKKLGKQKDIIQGLIDQLPKHHVFFQAFSPAFTNWLPLYWKGFEQTTKYTYVIEDLGDLDKIWTDTNANIKTDVRKAEKTLTIKTDRSFEEFYNILEMTYKRQSLAVPQSLEFLKRVYKESSKRNAGRIFFAVDQNEIIHSVLFLVWDANSAYYIISGADPELRNSGAGSYCLWNAIQFSSEVTQSFDFEGSMVEGIERFFRGFGAKQKPYFRLYRFSSLPIGIAYYIKRWISKKI